MSSSFSSLLTLFSRFLSIDEDHINSSSLDVHVIENDMGCE